MFTCFQEETKDSDSESTNRRLLPQGHDIKAMEKNLKPLLKASIRKLVHEDDSEGLEEALEAERSANPKPPCKKNKRKSGTSGTKEEDEFAILGRRILHYASALDAVECCKLLLTSQTFPRIWVDAVDEADQRSALHVACLNHSQRCIELLLKQGASAALKNKQLVVPLEEALLSRKVHVDWDFLTPAAQIVEKVRERDLSALRTLEQKCKDQLIPVAFKLAKSLKLVPLVALLIVARSAHVVNSVFKKVEGEEDSVGTLVDLLLGKALAYSSLCGLDNGTLKCKKDGIGEGWSGESSRLLRKTSFEADGLEVNVRRNTYDWESHVEVKHRRDPSDWEESSSEIKYRKDLSEWEEINSKYRSNVFEGESSNTDSKFRRSCSVDMDRKGPKTVEDKGVSVGEDVEANCKIARKLLECVLLFSPRLSAHPQSPSLPPLLRAAQANDDYLLTLLLDAGAPINETDSDGNTALHWALRQATPVNKRSVNKKLVKRLLDAGANVLMGNKLGATPVHTSAGHGHFEALHLILEKEAGGVNVMAATKETPLHYSVKNNHLLCTALLLTHGANRNVSSLRSQKPFQLAPSSEMRALLSLDEATLKEQTADSLLQTLAVVAQQQSILQQCAGAAAAAATMAPTFAQATAQSIAGAHLKSQFPFPPTMAGFPGPHPLSFSQSLSLPAQSESFNQPQLVSKSLSAQQFQPPQSLRSQSLPSAHESSSWTSPWLALQKAAQKLPSNGLDLNHLNHLCEGDLANGKSNVNLPVYKTVLCKFFGTSDGCGWGNKCHFAHSEEELRVGQLHLKIAGDKNDGGLGLKGLQLLGDSGDQGVKNFKTKLCMHHEKMGTCPHGGKCKFAHGDGELRPMSASSSLTTCTRIGPRPSTASSLVSSGSDDAEDASSRKVFVGGLPHFIHSDELWEFFESEFGKVVDAVVICGNDEEGKPRSRGFGFVLFEQQKDADEAVKRHYFPFRGKKVEVKRAMARMDSPSGDETGRMASSFSSGISSPAAPQSPAQPSSLPGVGLFNDGLQLSGPSAMGPPPGWSLPSLSVDIPQDGMQTSAQYAQGSASLLSEHKHLHHVNSGQMLPQNSMKLHMQDSGQFFQGSSSDQHPSCSAVYMIQNGIQPVSRNSRPQGEINSLAPGKPYADSSSYNDHSSPPVKPSMLPPLSNVTNGSVTDNSTSHVPFSYFDVSNSQPYFRPLQSTPTEPAEPNQGDEEEELSHLLELLTAPSAPSHSSSSAHTPAYSPQPAVPRFSSQTTFDRAQQVFPTQNGTKESVNMYIQDPPHLPYNGASHSLPTYSGVSTPGLPDGFREVPQPSITYKEAGQGSNGTGYSTSQTGTSGYNPHLPVGSKRVSDYQRPSNVLDAAPLRGVVGAVGSPSLNVMSRLLPGFNSQLTSELYDSSKYGGFPLSR